MRGTSVMSNEHTEQNIAGIDLRVILTDLLHGAKRTLWLAVVLVAVCASALCWRTYRSYRPSYQATASFTVYVTNPLYSGTRFYNAATAEQMAKTFPYILTSGVLSEMVMEKLDLSYMPAVSASVMEGTNIFTLSVTSDDPRLAYDVLQTVIESYPSVAEFVVGPTEMELLDESGVPTAPVNAQDYVSSAKRGAMIGAVLWIAVLAVLTMTRSTVHNEAELKRLINLPCLGLLPQIGAGRRKTAPVLMVENGKAGFGEAVRLLRIRVEKEMRQLNAKVLLVSSAIPGEGKTTVSANLAIALAHKKKRVLLVDCDLRDPSVGATFGKTTERGLSEYLRNEKTFKQIVCATDTEDLFIVCGGKPVTNASELLARPEAKRFIESACRAFDYVILDTPPCSMLADAAETAAIADCALMTIRQNYAAKDQILDGMQFLFESGLPMIGCVLNGMKRGVLEKGSYNSYYGYGRNYRAKEYENGEPEA